MKHVLFITAIIAGVLSSCSDNSNSSPNTAEKTDTATADTQSAATSADQASPEIKEMVSLYFALKNALVSDNGSEAASAGKQLFDALKRVDEAKLSADQRKVFDEVKEDAMEHAEHISENAGKINHQREHFDVLSQDVYDFIKNAKSDQSLYKIHCPMYNNGKGAFWLSEVREVKNPYYGKEMLTCGSVTEEIK